MSEITVEWRETGYSWREFTCDDGAYPDDGESMVEWIIRDRLAYDPAYWGSFDGEIEIRAPQEIAGLYEVSIDYEPTVSAAKIADRPKTSEAADG